MGEGLQQQTRSQKISRKGIFGAKGEVEHAKQGTQQVKRPRGRDKTTCAE